jgi:magnesium-transporting ATPase (P-type)
VTAIAVTVLLVTFLLSGLFTAFGFRLRFKSTRSKLFIAAVTYVVSLLTLAPLSFLLVMVIAGPHSGVLEPGIYSQITVLTGLFAILIIPVLAVYATLLRSRDGTHAT